MIRHALIIVTATIAALVTLPNAAHACSCLPPDIARSYTQATDVVKVRVERVVARAKYRANVLYRASVLESFKGCLEPGDTVILKTSSSSAACGIVLSSRRDYLINGVRMSSVRPQQILSINSCDYNQPFNQLTDADQEFLYSRFNSCGDIHTCNDGTDPVNCLVDPCENSTCDVEGARCAANYCGGCNAEWFDPSGARVCLDAGDAGVCEYDGQIYEAGDVFAATDGCNKCTCTDGGLVACTERACLPRECTPKQCGPAPLAPNYLCPDGVTVAGPGDCVRFPDGRCGWEFNTCPDEKGLSCGPTTCPAGQVCCNASCGICTNPGWFCTQQACTPLDYVPLDYAPLN